MDNMYTVYQCSKDYTNHREFYFATLAETKEYCSKHYEKYVLAVNSNNPKLKTVYIRNEYSIASLV